MPPRPPPPWVITRRQIIGANVRDARLAAELTQENLDELSGIDRQTINRIEHGHHAARIDTLIMLAAAIGVPLAHLVRD